MAFPNFLQSATGKLSSSLWLAPLCLRSSSTVTSTNTYSQAKPFESMPGPKSFPLIGNVWRFLPVIGEYVVKDAVGTQIKMRKKYGDIIRLSGIPGRPPLVFTFSPEDTETMFRSESQWPLRPGAEAFSHYYKKIRRDVTSGRVPTLAGNGKEWQILRSAVQQPIMQPRTARMYIRPVEEVADEFIERIRDMRDSKNDMPKDFHNELHKWSLESIAIVALDTRLGCLSPNLTSNSDPQKMIDAVQGFFDVFATLELGMPIWKHFKTPSWKKFEKSMDTFTSLCVKHINLSFESLKNRSSDNEEDLTLIQRLLKYDPDPGTALLAALDLLLAGIDSTSFSSANFLYLLAKNSDKQQILYEEICKFLPTKNTPVTDDRLDEMKYLKACLRETMRIAPVTAANFRITEKDTVLSGYKVPKGTTVFSGGVVMGTDPKNFPLADKFIPERWLRGENTGCPITKEEQSRVHPFASVPFGYGPRMCLGRRFAEMELQMLVLKAVQNFKVEFNYETRLSTADKLLYSLYGPMQFTFIDRK